MPNLRVTLGTVNFTDYIHVTASKVSSPAVIAWETWIDAPVTSYNFIIPGLDPENYYIRYYDAGANNSMGTLKMELLVNALTSEFLYERRFYTTGGSSTGDPEEGESTITDDYLIGKNVTGVFKEGFRYYEPGTEYSFDAAIGKISVLGGATFGLNEKVIVDIKYEMGTTPAAAVNPLYSGNTTVTEQTRTLTLAEINNRIRLAGSAETQVIRLPRLSTVTADSGYYFDNSVGGAAVQPKILTDGDDKILYGGFGGLGSTFAEFWVSIGEHLLLRKFNDDYWEVITDYKGVHVGERVAVMHRLQPGVIPEDGREIDGNVYGRLWYWINYMLPPGHYISDDSANVIPERIGQFIIRPATKKIIMPNTQGLSERGLKDFSSYGSDAANRPYDYPGGFQDELVKAHTHTVTFKNGKSDQTESGTQDQFARHPQAGGDNYGLISVTTASTGGDENRVKNIGVIYGRRI